MLNPVISFAQPNTIESRLQSLVQHRWANNGPNCYGSALYILGLKSEVLHATDFTAVPVISRYCQKLDVSIAQAPVNSLIIYSILQDNDPEPEFLHGFIKVGENRFFQKGDWSTDSPFEITSIETIDARYRSRRPRQCYSSDRCDVVTNVYSCDFSQANHYRDSSFAQLEQVVANLIVPRRRPDIADLQAWQSVLRTLSQPSIKMSLFHNVQNGDIAYVYRLLDLVVSLEAYFGGLQYSVQESILDSYKQTSKLISELLLLALDRQDLSPSLAQNGIFVALFHLPLLSAPASDIFLKLQSVGRRLQIPMPENKLISWRVRLITSHEREFLTILDQALQYIEEKGVDRETMLTVHLGKVLQTVDNSTLQPQIDRLINLISKSQSANRKWIFEELNLGWMQSNFPGRNIRAQRQNINRYFSRLPKDVRQEIDLSNFEVRVQGKKFDNEFIQTLRSLIEAP